MNRFSILFVDDEIAIAEVIRKMLERSGYTVTCVNGGKAALEIFQKYPDRFDLIITDYEMPDIKGNELSIKVKTIRKDIPIILLTGYTHLDVSMLEEWGISAILFKPFELSEIQILISKMIAR